MTEKARVIARLNARLQPLDRGSLYEDPLDEANCDAPRSGRSPAAER